MKTKTFYGEVVGDDSFVTGACFRKFLQRRDDFRAMTTRRDWLIPMYGSSPDQASK